MPFHVARFSAINVGETLLKNNALLLPGVYNLFTTKLKQVIEKYSTLLYRHGGLYSTP